MNPGDVARAPEPTSKAPALAVGLTALVLAGVTVVMVIAAGVALLLGHQHTASWSLSRSSDTSGVPDAAERARALTTAGQFALRVDGFDGNNPTAYEKSVTALLTTKYKADFDKQFAQIQQLGIQKGQKGQGTLLASGISTIDADSATVLVAHDNTITSASGSGQQHSRWVINLVKVGGRWLVDDFNPVS